MNTFWLKGEPSWLSSIFLSHPSLPMRQDSCGASCLVGDHIIEDVDLYVLLHTSTGWDRFNLCSILDPQDCGTGVITSLQSNQCCCAGVNLHSIPKHHPARGRLGPSYEVARRKKDASEKYLNASEKYLTAVGLMTFQYFTFHI